MFVKTIGPEDAKIMLVGEAPGEQEDRTGKPFVGNAGRVLTDLLNKAGINKHECLIANVARERPPANRISYFYEDSKMTIPKPIMKEWIEYLKQEIIKYKPNIVVALGATASYTLIGQKGIAKLRGYLYESTLVPRQKVLCTYHPQKTDYEYKLRFHVVMDFRKAKLNSDTPNLPVDDRTLNASPSRLEFMDYLKFLYFEHKDPIALDVETTQPGSHIDILGLAHTPTYGMSMRLLSNRKAVFSFQKEFEIWQWVAMIAKNQELIMHNAVYDMGVLWYNNSIYCAKPICTLVAGHIMWPECPRSLDFLSSICLNVPPWKDTSETFPTLYNCSDAVNTVGIWEVLEPQLRRSGNWDTFKFEMGQIEPATFLQLLGLPIDRDVQQQLLKEINAKQEIVSAELKQEFGREINLNSPKQVQNLLYEDLGLPIQYKRRKSVRDPRKRTADEEAIVKLARISDNPVLLKIIESKKLLKLKNSFVELIDKKSGNSKISPEGRVHTSYNVTGATMQKVKKGLVIDEEDSYKSFGRWSSSKSIILPYGSGNLQQIPYVARKMYRAPEGFELVQADFIQAEAVVVAYLINDGRMIEMFEKSFGAPREERDKNNWDIHRITAALMFQLPLDQVTPDQRTIGKVLRHANNYSAGPGVTAHKLGCALKEARVLNNSYHHMCPQLGLWHNSIRIELRKSMTLTNLLGRKHKFLERWGDTLFRSAYAYIPQSTVGDLLNKSLVKFYNKYGKDLTIQLQLHDAMYVLSPLGERQRTMMAMKDCMMHTLTANGKDFIIDVDFAVGPSWGELEEI